MHMQKKRIPSSIVIAGVLALGTALPVGAIGFGNGTPSTVLGRPLDFRVVVRLDPGETLDPACVWASVSVGDVKLPVEGIGTLVTTGPGDTVVVRVRTLMRVDEPLVAVQARSRLHPARRSPLHRLCRPAGGGGPDSCRCAARSGSGRRSAAARRCSASRSTGARRAGRSGHDLRSGPGARAQSQSGTPATQATGA
jgi:hypothetical protein